MNDSTGSPLYTCVVCGQLVAGEHICVLSRSGVEFRKVSALEVIGTSLASIATIMQKRLDKEHPEKPPVREAHVTKLKTPEEELELEQQGDDEEWGQRERDFLAQTRNKSGSGT